MKLHAPFHLSLLCLALAACQTTAPGTTAASGVPAPTPLQGVRHGMATADGQYALGRYYQGQLRHAEAIAAFRQVIAEQPGLGDAYNRLGISLAALGEVDSAIEAFYRARDLAPGAADIHNNLGYALLLRERLDEAIDEFLSALILAPQEERARDNYDRAMAQRHGPPPPPPDIPPGLPPVTEPSPVYVIADAPAPAVEGEAMEGKPGLRLEITNGNGIRGLARRTSHALAAAGYPRPRLTNAPAYDVRETVIEYRPGHEREAARLQRHLTNTPPTAPSAHLRADIGLRLVLGHDGRSQEKQVSLGNGR